MACYLVTRENAAEGEKPRIVEARTKAQAVGFVARDSYAAVPISTKAAMAYAKEGVELEYATTEGGGSA